MKRLLSVLLAFLLVASIIPFGSFTVSAVTSGNAGNCVWTIDDNGVMTVDGQGRFYVSDHSLFKQVKKLIVNSGVTEIGSYTFYYCENLETVILPEGITSLDEGTFFGCKNLKKITVPESLTKFGFEVFCFCDNIKTAGPIGGGYDYEFGWKTAIPVWAFMEAGIKSVVIPEGITTIGTGAFTACIYLKTFDIPSSLTTINSSAFSSCHSLEDLLIPDSVTSIDNWVFDDCKNLTILCHEDSYAYKYAIRNKIPVNLLIDFSKTGNSLEYPIFNEERFASTLKIWAESSEYADAFKEYINEGHTYKELLYKTIDTPIMTSKGGASIESDVQIKDLMAYILFVDEAKKYMNGVTKNVKTKLQENSNEAFKYFLERIENFNRQYYAFQKSLNGKDRFNQTFYSLLLAKTAMAAINEIKVTYKTGEIEYITYAKDEYDRIVAEYVTEDVESVANLSSFCYLVSLSKALMTEPTENYDNLYYYILSGGDTSYLNEYYRKHLDAYTMALKDAKSIGKFVLKKSDITDAVDFTFDNLNYFAEKYSWNCADGISDASAVWQISLTAKDIIKSVSQGSMLGLIGGIKTLTDTYINNIKAAYDNVAAVDAGWYALSYYYLGYKNENLLKAIVDPNTGSAEFDISRMITYGFPVNENDIIQKYISRYYEKYSALTHTYTPDEEFRLYLWNICNTAVNIMKTDSNSCKDMMFGYILAENNLENDVAGIPTSVETYSADTTLGNTSGNIYCNIGEKATVTAIPYENCTFSSWIDEETGDTASTDMTYTFEVDRPVKLRAEFVAGDVKTAEKPSITTTPRSATYYAGQTAKALTVLAQSTDGGSISVKWYKSNGGNSGGTLVGSGYNYSPSTATVGTAYYYAVVTNTFSYTVGTQTTISKATVTTSAVSVITTDPIITGIEVLHNPYKTEYLCGEDFDTDGLQISVKYSNSTSCITDNYTVSYDFSTFGNKKVAITCYGRTVYADVTVKAISDLEILRLPDVREFESGGQLDLTGMTVTAFINGVKTIITDYTVTGFDNISAGIQTVSVSYGNCSATFNVAVGVKFESGDASGDGVIDEKDVDCLLDLLLGDDIPTTGAFDIVNDGVIDVRDVVALKYMLEIQKQ